MLGDIKLSIHKFVKEDMVTQAWLATARFRKIPYKKGFSGAL